MEQYLGAAAIVIAALATYALYIALGWSKHECAICAKQVRERRANEWSRSNGETVYTHYGQCSEHYNLQYLQDHYAPTPAARLPSVKPDPAQGGRPMLRVAEPLSYRRIA